MDDGQGQEEGWEALDLRSGVAKVYGEAKQRIAMGQTVLAAWAGAIMLLALLNLGGVATSAPVGWDFIAAVGGLLVAAAVASREPTTMALGAGVVLGDLLMTAYKIPETMDHGGILDQLTTAIRLIGAPVALYMVLNGYFGCLAVQAFKKGFSPGTDWRTRMAPATMQFVVAGASVLALGAGFTSWVGSVMWGLEQTDVVWATTYLVKADVKLKVARPAAIKSADTDGKQGGLTTEIEVVKAPPAPVEPSGPPKLPETVWPILSSDGMDDYGVGEVEDAFDFAKDASEQECLAEGQGRQDRCRDDRCRYWARVFTRACLPKSRKTPHFCDTVPQAALVEAGTKWAEAMCAGRKLEICRELLYAVQGHCHTAELAKSIRAETPVPGNVPSGVK